MREMSRIRGAVAIPIMAVAAACAEADQGTGGVQVQIKDSAGVRIVEYDGMPEVEAPFQFAAEPLYRHGANPGDYAFQGVRAGSLFPDGGAVVSDVFNQELLLLSPDGASHEVLAGPGEGPGDVAYVGATFSLGRDRFVATDSRLGRVTFFGGGAVERTVDIQHAGGLRVVGIDASGGLMMTTGRFMFGFSEEWLQGHMARVDMETGAVDTVASYDLIKRPPVGLRYSAVAGSGWISVADGQFVYTRSDRPEVSWRLSDGTVTRIVRWRAEPAPVTEDMLEGIESGVRDRNQMANPGLSDAGIDRMTDEVMASFRAAIGEPMPLFTGNFADGEGRIWLPFYQLGAARGIAPGYRVISADGDWLGTVEAPPNFRLLDVAHGLVLGVQLDELGVESVVLYELVDASARTSSLG